MSNSNRLLHVHINQHDYYSIILRHVSSILQRGHVYKAVGLQPEPRVHKDHARPRPQRVLGGLLAGGRHRVLRQQGQDHQGLGGRHWVRNMCTHTHTHTSEKGRERDRDTNTHAYSVIRMVVYMFNDFC